MPKPEVKTHTVYCWPSNGRFYAGKSVNDLPVRINPDGTWVFVDDQDREILHWDLKLKVGDRVRLGPSVYVIEAADPTRENPYRVAGGYTDWYDIGIERWKKVEPAPVWRFVPGDLVHSARAGGTFRIKEIVEAGRVCRMEDSEGRVTPFDLDYVQSHFKRFGEAA